MQKIHGVGRESPFQMTEVSVLSISVQASSIRPGVLANSVLSWVRWVIIRGYRAQATVQRFMGAVAKPN